VRAPKEESSLPLLSAVRDFDLPHSEQSGVDGPRAGPNQRQRDGDRAEKRVEPNVSGARVGVPRRGGGGQHACDRRPKPGDQQQSEQRGERLNSSAAKARACRQRGAAVTDQRAARAKAHHQKADAGRAVRERREESSHPPSLTKGPARPEDAEGANALTLLGRGKRRSVARHEAGTPRVADARRGRRAPLPGLATVVCRLARQTTPHGRQYLAPRFARSE